MPYRNRHAPRPIYGMRLQADASIHAWLENRGPKLAFVAMIDDATNQVWGAFRGYEDAAGYVEVLQDICLKDGIPMTLYTDKRNVFQDQRELSIEDQLAGKERTTHFKAIFDRLGIELIQADSPQARSGAAIGWAALSAFISQYIEVYSDCSTLNRNKFYGRSMVGWCS